MVAVAALVVVGIAGAAAYVAFAGDDGPARRELHPDPVFSDAAEVGVRVVDKDFEPRDLTIKRGARVTWVWDGDLPHNVIDDRGGFESPTLQDGDEWSMTFEEPGEYYYYCSLHHIMQGTLRVVD